MSAQGR